MSKRFTDSEKWDDEWFLSLDNDSRIVWQFILDKCSIAGCWKKNFSMLNFCCHVQWDSIKFKEVFNGRVVDRGEYFFIPKFVKFQNPKGLNSDKPAVISIRKELLDRSLDVMINELFGNDYLIIKGKGMVREEERVKERIISKDCKVCGGRGEVLAQGSGKVKKCWECGGL